MSTAGTPADDDSATASGAPTPSSYIPHAKKRGRREADEDGVVRRDTARTRDRGEGTSTKERKERQKLQRKNLFAKDLPAMMYAFGDDPEPLPETVAILEEVLVDYLTDLCKDAAGHSTNAKKLKLDDLKFALRRPQQARQLARVEELLYLQEDIARARRNLDITYGAKGAAF
ncbi:hypothetical protein EMMF5_003400 [Cystobasidiomycetes sp. EMM_F5]